ncbi:hypothetical protein WA026_019368 [Henosepilachna vigintioctopunctata]|uniref:Uncharacterized protein n=1 Tax=Henosepilachna vigintioctopunctata TaxID=420089 RepID=A0AAW1UAP9_9CUCU
MLSSDGDSPPEPAPPEIPPRGPSLHNSTLRRRNEYALPVTCNNQNNQESSQFITQEVIITLVITLMSDFIKESQWYDLYPKSTNRISFLYKEYSNDITSSHNIVYIVKEVRRFEFTTNKPLSNPTGRLTDNNATHATPGAAKLVPIWTNAPLSGNKVYGCLCPPLIFIDRIRKTL